MPAAPSVSSPPPQHRSAPTSLVASDEDAFAADLTSGTGAADATVRDPRVVGAVLVGGFVGTVGRAGLAEAWVHSPTSWPWATFTVNLVGAFVLGAVAMFLHSRPTASGYWRPLLGTGLCGGLTTFSTMQLEIVRMWDAGSIGLAVGYTVVSIGAGLLAVLAGARLVASR